MARKIEKTIGEKIKELRQQAGLTQQSLAVRSSLPIQTLRDLEQGATTDPKVSTVRAIAEALKVRTSALID